MVLSRIEYALPVWRGYLNAEITGRINSIIRRRFEYGFCKVVFKL